MKKRHQTKQQTSTNNKLRNILRSDTSILTTYILVLFLFFISLTGGCKKDLEPTVITIYQSTPSIYPIEVFINDVYVGDLTTTYKTVEPTCDLHQTPKDGTIVRGFEEGKYMIRLMIGPVFIKEVELTVTKKGKCHSVNVDDFPI